MWLETSVVLWYPTPGGALHSISFTRDISDLKHAAAAQRDSEERYRAVSELSWDLLSEMNADGHQIFVGPGSEKLIGYTSEVAAAKRQLADFLLERLYRHRQVVRMAAKAERILRDLWRVYQEDPRLLPTQIECREDEPAERAIADYLAGMTDRFAMDEHRRLFDPHVHA